MAVVKFQSFGGEIPRLPGQLLPDVHAQFAQNCDFMHGELRGLREAGAYWSIPLLNVAGFSLGTVSVYTEDGAYFFGWPWEADVVRSQVIGDSYYRIFYTGQPSDSPVVKVARTFRNTGGIPQRVIGSDALLGDGSFGSGQFKPPEITSPVAVGGNGLGPDSWFLGIPAPKVQNLAETDTLAASLVDKQAWPYVPRLKLKVTLFWENAAGEIVKQFDCSSTDEALDVHNAALPQVTWTLPPDQTHRGSKIQDFLWAVGGQVTGKPQPYKMYWINPPSDSIAAVSRSVDLANNDTTGNTIDITYGPPPEAAPPTTDLTRNEGA